MRQIVLYQDGNGYWVAHCPSQEGCMSQGKTKGEALANIRAAIAGCSAVLEEGDVPISEENFETFLIMTSYKLD